MFKVECEQCKAPYPIDERRVPPAGLKMRCPKCGHSFVVMAPGAQRPAAPPPRRPNATIVGGVGLDAPAAQAGATAPPPKPKGNPTIVGIAPPPLPPAPAAAAPKPTGPASMAGALSDFPAALGTLDDWDLPAVRAELPVPKIAAAASVRATTTAAAPALSRGARPAAHGELDADLPVVSAGLPAASKGDLPSVRGAGAMAKPAPPPGGRANAPAPKLPGPAVTAAAAKPRAAAPAATRASPEFEIDLPAVSAGLPALRAPPPPTKGAPTMPGVPPTRPQPADASDLDLPASAANLPVVSAPLPAAKRMSFELDLPALVEVPGPAARDGERLDLPAPLPPGVEFPAVSAQFPVRAADPAQSASLPQAMPSSSAAVFGEIDLPPAGMGGFGELDLPGEPPPAPTLPPMATPEPAIDAGFGELKLSEPPASRATAPTVSAHEAQGVGVGLGFGEVDLGGGDHATEGRLDALPRPAAAVAGVAPPVASASAELTAVPVAPTVARALPGPKEKRKASPAKVAAAVLVTLGLIGGAALQLTPYGAFGYLATGDRLHAGAYARATAQAIADYDRTAAPDTYEAAKAAADAVAAAHARTPRAKQLTAYAAFVDAMLAVRFGPDGKRAARAKQLLAELPASEPVRFLDAATAAQAAANEDFDRAGRALNAAEQKDTGDPIRLDEALLRGELELATHDGAQALATFQKTVGPSNDARAHFGMARAYALMGDTADAAKALAATLAASPGHPGALTLRARLATGTAGAAQGEKELAPLFAGGAPGKLAPGELSAAYAAKAWLLVGKGLTSDAREAFSQAVKLDPRSVDALNGEGRLLLGEGRYTEALARFDKALQYDAASPETIANDAEAKLDVERPADAKQQLVEAKVRFPKSLPILLLLGRVEQHLADNDAAEADLRAACAAVDPARNDAIQPYVALSELLAARGRLADARAALEEAKKRLTMSAALERAFGEVAELEGDYPRALAHYRAALGIDTNDAPSHFHLAGLLRRTKEFDEAAAELDKVAAIDKDYAGLSLERGLLYEQAGDVERAIDEFRAALAKASDDPDLQLRVGEAYVAIGRTDEAIPMLKKVIDRRPGSAEAQHYMGRALMLRPDTDSQIEGMRYLKRAAEIDPNRAEFHVYLAWAANDATPPQLDLAQDEVAKALAIDKLDAEAYWQRGIVEFVEGEIDDAIRDEKHALELRPSRTEAHATLAQCYEEKNDDATALTEWPKAIAGEPKPARGSEDAVQHPFWHYRYGKLLWERGQNGPALAQLAPAAATAEKLDTHPGWLPSLEFLLAEALHKAGRKNDAVDHYKRFLEIAPQNSPDRADAKAALANTGR